MFNEFSLTRGFDFETYVKFFWLYGSRMYVLYAPNFKNYICLNTNYQKYAQKKHAPSTY